MIHQYHTSSLTWPFHLRADVLNLLLVIELSPNQMHACTNHGSLCIDVISRHANTEDGNDDVEE